MFEKYQLPGWPGYAKLFVGLFVILMLLVALWSIFILYVEKGIIEEGALPPYLMGDNDDSLAHEELPTKDEVAVDVAMLSEDSLARLAPIWDSVLSGQDALVDSSSMAEFFPKRDSQLSGLTTEPDNRFLHDENKNWKEKLRHNVGLAHTHINGQTLLFFALGFVFLFTTAKPKLKTILLSVMGAAILFHAIGLSGESFHWFFDDILAISGLLLLVVIPYMSFLIFIDLFKQPKG